MNTEENADDDAKETQKTGENRTQRNTKGPQDREQENRERKGGVKKEQNRNAIQMTIKHCNEQPL